MKCKNTAWSRRCGTVSYLNLIKTSLWLSHSLVEILQLALLVEAEGDGSIGCRCSDMAQVSDAFRPLSGLQRSELMQGQQAHFNSFDRVNR